MSKGPQAPGLIVRARIFLSKRDSGPAMHQQGMNDHLLRDLGYRRDLTGFDLGHLVRF